MVYQLKTRKYHGNAKQILEINQWVGKSPVEHTGIYLVGAND